MAPENGAIYHYTCPSMATTMAAFKCSILKAAAVYVTIDSISLFELSCNSIHIYKLSNI
jgi:hypothetical protein